MSQSKKAKRGRKRAGTLISLSAGDFVLIDSTNRQPWVAQLLESYTGYPSNEVRSTGMHTAIAILLMLLFLSMCACA